MMRYPIIYGEQKVCGVANTIRSQVDRHKSWIIQSKDRGTSSKIPSGYHPYGTQSIGIRLKDTVQKKTHEEYRQ